MTDLEDVERRLPGFQACRHEKYGQVSISFEACEATLSREVTTDVNWLSAHVHTPWRHTSHNESGGHCQGPPLKRQGLIRE